MVSNRIVVYLFKLFYIKLIGKQHAPAV